MRILGVGFDGLRQEVIPVLLFYLNLVSVIRNKGIECVTIHTAAQTNVLNSHITGP